ncbi:MAG: NAD(P)H-dependent oxidoreductase [Candidatus Omnitrophica bacterium]|nr:NAD(P)H-dependent oxidoreductase [Candidatus Omnitrophota bacterium]
MRTLITYYSFSGNTDKVANIFADLLRKKGEVVLQRLKPADEIKKFAPQCKAAFTGKRAVLEGDLQFDLGQYDLLLIGSPVWAFAPTPSINTYLDKLSGLNGKRAIILLTSGSGTGVNRCFKNIRKVLESKGASKVDEVNVPDRKLNDTGFITAALEKVL